MSETPLIAFIREAVAEVLRTHPQFQIKISRPLKIATPVERLSIFLGSQIKPTIIHLQESRNPDTLNVTIFGNGKSDLRVSGAQFSKFLNELASKTSPNQLHFKAGKLARELSEVGSQ